MQRLQQRSQNAVKHAARQAEIKAKRRKLPNSIMTRIDPEFFKKRAQTREQEQEKKLARRKQREAVEHFQRQFKVGDRVCLVAPTDPDNPDKGRISVVTEVRRKEKACLVQDLSDPSDSFEEEPLETDEPQPIPMSALRPVKTIYNPLIKRPEDIILGLDTDTYALEPSRAADPKSPFSEASTEAATQRAEEERAEERAAVEAKEEEEQRERLKSQYRPKWLGPEESQDNEHEIDTLRVDVEAKTWTPSLIRQPFPGGVIDELRGKYSRFRNNHDPEFVAKKEEEERLKVEKEAFLKEGGGMLASPLKELKIKEKMEAEQRGEASTRADVPSPELMELIGRKMVERGVVKLPAETKEGVVAQAERKGKPLPVAAAEWDKRLKDERRKNREGARLYWPLKGWKEKQRRDGKKVPEEVLPEVEAQALSTRTQ